MGWGKSQSSNWHFGHIRSHKRVKPEPGYYCRLATILKRKYFEDDQQTLSNWIFPRFCVWKSQKNFHSKLRANGYFSGQKCLNMPKYDGSATRQVNGYMTKIGGKCQNWKMGGKIQLRIVC